MSTLVWQNNLELAMMIRELVKTKSFQGITLSEIYKVAGNDATEAVDWAVNLLIEAKMIRKIGNDLLVRTYLP